MPEFPFRDLDVSSSLSWFQREVIGNTINIEYGNILYNEEWASGTGVGRLNKSYFNTGSIGSGENRRFDLHALQRRIYDEVLTVNFASDRIKLFYIENKSTGANQDLFLVSTGENSMTNIFSWGYLGTHIRPRCYHIFGNRGSGAICNETNRYFYLEDINDAGPINYEIGIFGVE